MDLAGACCYAACMTPDAHYRLIYTPPGGAPEGEELLLAPERSYRIGRALGNELPLADPSVSRHHLELRWAGGRWLARDLGSRNGSRLNGRPLVEESALAPGDRLHLGDVELLLKGAAPLPDESGSLTLVDGELGHTLRSLDTEHFLGDPSLPAVPGKASVFQRLDRAAHSLLTHCEHEKLPERIIELVGSLIQPDRAILLLPPVGAALESAADLAALAPEQLSLRAEFRAPKASARPPRLSRSILNKVLGERQALLVGDALSDQRFSGQESVVLEQLHSVLCAPLWDDERVTGLIYADRLSPLNPLNEEDLQLLTLLAHLAAVRLRESAAEAALAEQRRLEEELERAAQIQRQLLPEGPLVLGRLYAVGQNEQSLSVGGDYFDAFACEGGRALIALGDVAGKGMGAALLMAQLQAMLRALGETGMELTAMTAQLNAAMHRSTRGRRFVTLFLACIEPESGALHYVNAGHNPPLLLRASGELEALRTGGLMLGAFQRLAFERGETRLGPGDTLLIYSDGLSEAGAYHGEDMFGEERIEALLRKLAAESPEAIVAAMVAAARDFCAPLPPDDDLTVLVARLG